MFLVFFGVVVICCFMMDRVIKPTTSRFIKTVGLPMFVRPEEIFSFQFFP